MKTNETSSWWVNKILGTQFIQVYSPKRRTHHTHNLGAVCKSMAIYVLYPMV